MMTNHKDSGLIDDLIYADRWALLNDPVGCAAREAVASGVVDPLVRELIGEPVRRHKIAQAFAGPFPLPRLCHGNLVLGTDVNGRPVRVPVHYLNGHSITVGNSGSGKTTRSHFMTLQVAPMVRGVWLFDFRKREFRILRPLLARMGVGLIIVPARKLRINPLQVPEGVDPADWAPRASDLIVMVFQLPPRATRLLHSALHELYRRMGIFAGGDHFPILAELREEVAIDSKANPQARQAILDALDPVLMSIGAALQYRIGWTTEILATRRIVFEFAGISEADKNLLLCSLILPEFTRRIACGISNPAMDLWICCDEAARLVSSTGAHAMADMIGLVRGTGVGLDFSVQSADVLPAVLSNTANKFIGRCGSATDYDSIGSAMGLSAEQRRTLALSLSPGQFAGQVGEGEWRHPFLFKVPAMNIEEVCAGTSMPSSDGGPINIDSGGIDELMALPIVLAGESVDPQSPPDSIDHPLKETSIGGSHLSDAEIRYLKAVVDHPGQPSNAYTRLAGVGAQRAQTIRKHLVSAGFIREHAVQTRSRGRAAIVLEPLGTAFRTLNEKNVRETGGKS